jgi:hypothetical protein
MRTSGRNRSMECSELPPHRESSVPRWRPPRKGIAQNKLNAGTQRLYAAASLPRRTVCRTSNPSNCGWSR